MRQNTKKRESGKNSEMEQKKRKNSINRVRKKKKERK